MMQIENKKLLIKYYNEVDDFSSNYLDCSVSHNNDNRSLENIMNLENYDLIKYSCVYPNELYYEFYQDIKSHYNINNFIVGSGSEDLIFRINHNILRHQPIGVVVPNFYRIYETINRPKFIMANYDISNEIIDINNLNSCIKKYNLKSVWISNPNPIIGKCYNRKDLLGIISDNPDVLFIIDESNIEFVNKKENLELIKYVNKYSNIIVIRSFSKFFALPGIRIGLLITENSKILKYFSQNAQVFPISSPSIIIAKSALNNYQFYRNLNYEIQNNKTRLLQELETNKEIKVSKSLTNILMLSSETKKVWQVLKRQGILSLDLSKEVGIMENNAVRLTVHSCNYLFNRLYKSIKHINLQG